MIRNNSQPINGFTLIEVLAGMAIIAIIAGTIAAIFPLNVKIVERGTTEVEISAAAKSIKDAIITGAKENYNPNENRFYFIYEGVAVSVDLPQIGTVTAFPGNKDDELRNQELLSKTLGLYPSGLFYTGQVMQVYRVGTGTTGRLPELRNIENETGNPTFDNYIGPSFDEDIDLNDGAITGYLDVNKNNRTDTFEDVGIDGKRDEYENGYHAINNPDPSSDNFDPINNPFGTERNGCIDGEMEDINNNGYLDIPDMRTNFNPKTYLHDPSFRIANYGYTIRIIHQSVIDSSNNFGSNTFTFEVAIYKDFFKARPALQSARQEVVDAAARPELDIIDGKDNDGDGHKDANDKITTDANNKIIGEPAAIPEIALNGIDDDGDGFIDDGIVKPDFVERFQIVF